MHKGSCLCGTVRYEIDGEITGAVFCHCQRCRKAGGSAFAANAPVIESNFKIVQGAEVFKVFSTPAGVHRYFCSNCGSPIISKRDAAPGFVRLRLGTLDTPLMNGPTERIFVDSKAEWDQIFDSLPQHAERAPI